MWDVCGQVGEGKRLGSGYVVPGWLAGGRYHASVGGGVSGAWLAGGRYYDGVGHT